MLSSLAMSNFPAAPVAASLVLIGVMILLGQQVHKELASAQKATEKIQVWIQVVVIGAVPLVIAFLLVVMINMGVLTR